MFTRMVFPTPSLLPLRRPPTPPPSSSSTKRASYPILFFFSLFTVSCLGLFLISFHVPSLLYTLCKHLSLRMLSLYRTIMYFDWGSAASFRITDAMRVSIAMSMALGVLLGVGVGLISGLEPAVVIGVSASMAMGCVFVMSFAILHGVNALRAVCFALFVSICLPFGFGFGFGVGILVGVFLGLEDAEEIREKTGDFVRNFWDFVRVVAAFTLEIL